MENQPTKLDKAVKISIIVGILLIAFSVFYYIVIFLPKKEAPQMKIQKLQEQQAEAKAEQDRKINLLGCISAVDNKYVNQFQSETEAQKYQDEKNGIPPAQQTEIDNCYKKYGQ